MEAGRGVWATHWCGREKEGEVENGPTTSVPVAGKTNRSQLRREAWGGGGYAGLRRRRWVSGWTHLGDRAGNFYRDGQWSEGRMA